MTFVTRRRAPAGQSYRYCHTHMWLFIRGALVEHNLADYVQICMAVPVGPAPDDYLQPIRSTI